MIKYCLESKAMTVIFPLQDILGLSSEARMNTPGTTDNGNWEWRLNPELLTNKIKNKVKFLTIESER
jgi:4-alpha-glucanotransferase